MIHLHEREIADPCKVVEEPDTDLSFFGAGEVLVGSGSVDDSQLQEACGGRRVVQLRPGSSSGAEQVGRVFREKKNHSSCAWTMKK